jgi:hypothetical protein
MANKKISQLTDGTSFQSGDEAVVNRSGVNFKVDPTQFGSSIDVTGTVTADGLTVEGTSTVSTFPNSDFTIDIKSNGANGTYFGTDYYAGALGKIATIQAQYAGFIGNARGSLHFGTRAANQSDIFQRMAISSDGDISFYEDTGTTPKFFWDASAERLAIGVGTSPDAAMHVGEASYPQIRTVYTGIDSWDMGVTSGSIFRLGKANAADSASLFQTDSGNVGIGTSSPENKLHINSGALSIDGTSTVGARDGFTSYGIKLNGAETGIFHEFNGGIRMSSSGNPSFMAFHTRGALDSQGSERVRIDSSGNVGIGIVPDAWAITGPAIQLGGTGHLATSNQYAYVGSNYYYDGGWKYTTSSTAAQYRQDSGTHQWLTAASGTADAALTWSESMRIASDGKVGIGTSSPNRLLDIENAAGDAFVSIVSDPTSRSAIFLGDTGSDAVCRLDYDNNTNSLSIWTNSAEAMRITSAGNVGIGTTSPSQALDVVGNIEVSGGVYLGGTVAANLLDDYEEGTWTPAWAFAGGSATIGTINFATYTKVGQLVTVSFRAFTSSISSPTGQATITGLPFASADVESSGAIGVMIRFATDMPDIKCRVSGSSIQFEKAATNAGVNVYLDGSDFNSGAGQNIVSVCITYRTSA